MHSKGRKTPPKRRETTTKDNTNESRAHDTQTRSEGGKMTKLEQLQSMVEKWRESHSLTTAYDICEFLAKNLGGKHEA